MSTLLDELDRSLLVLLLENPRGGLRECARILGVARGTVAARFLRLQESGVITGFALHVAPALSATRCLPSCCSISPRATPTPSSIT
jgi:DNA-binding Lrp family transcriptional regulator